MESWKGKHFSITDPKGVNTVIYEVYKTNKEYLDKYPKYTVERLRSTEQIVGDFKKENLLCRRSAGQRKPISHIFFCQRKSSYQ